MENGLSTKSTFTIGMVVWAKVEGYPYWPALIVPYETSMFLPPGSQVPDQNDNLFVCQFFSDGRISLVSPKNIQSFEGNSDLMVNQNHSFFPVIKQAVIAGYAWINSESKRGAYLIGSNVDGTDNRAELLVQQLENCRSEIRSLKDRLNLSNTKLNHRKKRVEQLEIFKSENRSLKDRLNLSNAELNQSNKRLQHLANELRISEAEKKMAEDALKEMARRVNNPRNNELHNVARISAKKSNCGNVEIVDLVDDDDDDDDDDDEDSSGNDTAESSSVTPEYRRRTYLTRSVVAEGHTRPRIRECCRRKTNRSLTRTSCLNKTIKKPRSEMHALEREKSLFRGHLTKAVEFISQLESNIMSLKKKVDGDS